MTSDTPSFRLPPLAVMPRNGELQPYGFNEDPLANRPNLAWYGTLPDVDNRRVGKSIVGVGYETLCRDTFEPQLTYAKMARTGVKWARLQSGWLKCERRRGVYDFRWLDATVDALLAIGIQPWLSVSFGNPLYTPIEGYDPDAEHPPDESVSSFVRGFVGEVPLYHGAAAVAAWENYLEALTTHFRGRITHWEIWNEPNTAPFGFWQTHGHNEDRDRSEFEAACAADYVELVRISATAIRRVDPDAQIIGGSLSLTLDACFYVRNLMRNGITQYIDIFSFHPYGSNPEFGLRERYDNIRHELDAHGGRHIRIWQGECGYATIPSPESRTGNHYAQAKYLARRFTIDFKVGCEMSSYFMVMDKQGYLHGKGKVCGYGVLDCEGNPKMSLQALRSIGFLFADAEHAEDLYIRINNFGTPMRSHLRTIATVTTAFRRNGTIPVFSYHVPENPDLSLEPGVVDIQLWMDDGYTLTNPVLIDPIRGNVCRITEFESAEHGFKHRALGFDEIVRGFFTLSRMPLVDYPLFITDAALLGQPLGSNG